MKQPTPAALLPLALALAACGGGGDGGTTAAAVDDPTAQAMSADSAAMHEDGGAAADTLVATTQAAATTAASAGAWTGASRSVACAGGGTATLSATAGTSGTIGDGVLDPGEVYTLSYSACRGAAGWAQLDGIAALTVVANTGGTLQVDTTTQDLAIALPRRTHTWNGASTITRSVATAGATVTTTTRWTSPQIVVASRRNLRTSTFTLTALDLTRSVTATAGVPSAWSASGGYTMGAVRPLGSWSITVATQGAVAFDAAGVPTQGSWSVTLPANRIGVSVVPGTATITIDHGPDGSIDRTLVITTGTLDADAG